VGTTGPGRAPSNAGSEPSGGGAAAALVSLPAAGLAVRLALQGTAPRVGAGGPRRWWRASQGVEGGGGCGGASQGAEGCGGASLGADRERNVVSMT